MISIQNLLEEKFLMKDYTIKIKQILINTGVIIFWILIWEILYLIINRELFLPSPMGVFLMLKKLIFSGRFWISVFISVIRVIIGFVISVILGLILGVLSGINKYIYTFIYPVMNTIKSTPVMSFIIIALLWFSSGNVPIFIGFLICFPIIWTNVVQGVRNVDNELLQMAKVYRVKRMSILMKIYIPSIIPYFAAGSMTSLGLGWKATVAAEVLSNPKYSIGANLYNAKVYLETQELFAWTLMVIILSISFEKTFSYFINNLTYKKQRG